jgi:hypothetical protein
MASLVRTLARTSGCPEGQKVEASVARPMEATALWQLESGVAGVAGVAEAVVAGEKKRPPPVAVVGRAADAAAAAEEEEKAPSLVGGRPC